MENNIEMSKVSSTESPSPYISPHFSCEFNLPLWYQDMARKNNLYSTWNIKTGASIHFSNLGGGGKR